LAATPFRVWLAVFLRDGAHEGLAELRQKATHEAERGGEWLRQQGCCLESLQVSHVPGELPVARSQKGSHRRCRDDAVGAADDDPESPYPSVLLDKLTSPTEVEEDVGTSRRRHCR
jgi:hypothetical protein